ncbi:hypothetical protein [Corynebacterium hadale]|uniref:hypothetical protein n=1 Tax=Corynebacterium hadale TaxID=2026255 RepID=UPI001F0A69B4|nr:hypothetical protein [Corynebacterium hadale]
MLVHSFELRVREANELKGWDDQFEVTGSYLLDFYFLAVETQLGGEFVLQDIRLLATGDTPFEEFRSVLSGV